MSTRLTQNRLRQIIKEELSRALREGDPEKDASDREYADYIQQQHGRFTSPENLPASMRPHRVAPSAADQRTAAHYRAREALGMTPDEEEFYARWTRESDEKAEEEGEVMNEMDMMGDEEDEFARRPSEQNLDAEKYLGMIMRNSALKRYSKSHGGFSVADVVDLFGHEMSNDLEEMGIEADERTIYDEVHDLLDMAAAEGLLDIDSKDPSVYRFIISRKAHRM